MNIEKIYGILIVRLNSTNDVNYGANKGEKIEKHLYKTDIIKRYFDETDINHFFEDMKIISCNEVVINSEIHDNKIAWEVVMVNA